jgi:hypothetical protein
MSQAVIDRKVALLAVPSFSAQLAIEASLKPATRNRKGVPLEAFRYEVDLFSSCSCTQAKRVRALHDARKLVLEKVPGPHDDEENTYFAVCSCFAHLGQWASSLPPLWHSLPIYIVNGIFKKVTMQNSRVYVIITEALNLHLSIEREMRSDTDVQQWKK